MQHIAALERATDELRERRLLMTSQAYYAALRERVAILTATNRRSDHGEATQAAQTAAVLSAASDISLVRPCPAAFPLPHLTFPEAVAGRTRSPHPRCGNGGAK